MTSEIILSAPNRDEVLRYMGVPPQKADEAVCALADDCANLLLQTVRPRWCGRLFQLTPSDSPCGVYLSNGLLLAGHDIADHLSDCTQAVVFCATLGAEADALIRRTQYTDLARALALDCAAGALVEQLCDRIEQTIHTQYPNHYSPYRFSPGYGDLPLGAQPVLLAALDAHRLVGLSATDRLIMTPRKSVTAILGLSDSPIPTQKRSCVLCPNTDGCQLRKTGGHCGL